MEMSSESGFDEGIPHEFRPVVYVAGPFRYPEPFVNIRNSIVVGNSLDSSGVITAWVPHQNAMWDLVCPRTAEFWLDYDMAQLARSDALFRIPGASDGADDEEAFAKDVGMPIFYNDEVEAVAWAKEWLANQ